MAPFLQPIDSPRPVYVTSVKHPDLPRYCFPGWLVADTPRYQAIYSPAGVPILTPKGPPAIRATAHSLGIYYPDRYYHPVLFWNARWKLRFYYANIATPLVWDGPGRAHYVDYYLDVVMSPGERSEPRLEDEDEFLQSLDRHRYEDGVEEALRGASAAALIDMHERCFPYNPAMRRWRPPEEATAERLMEALPALVGT